MVLQESKNRLKYHLGTVNQADNVILNFLMSLESNKLNFCTYWWALNQREKQKWKSKVARIKRNVQASIICFTNYVCFTNYAVLIMTTYLGWLNTFDIKDCSVYFITVARAQATRSQNLESRFHAMKLLCHIFLQIRFVLEYNDPEFPSLSQASVVEWYNSRLPRGRPGFDSRPTQSFVNILIQALPFLFVIQWKINK